MGVMSLLVGAGPAPAAAQAPIKIGFLSPLSGAIAQAGKDMYSGCAGRSSSNGSTGPVRAIERPPWRTVRPSGPRTV